MESISDLLKWSENAEEIDHFCSNGKGKLPSVVTVMEGYLGVKDSIGKDEMFYLFDRENQTRVVAKKLTTKEIFSIPLDCSVKFHQFSSPPVGNIICKPKPLKTIIARWQLDENKRWIVADNNRLLEYFVDSNFKKTSKLGILEIVETFDLKYVLGLSMSNEGINTKIEAIPDFLNITVTKAVGSVLGDESAFTHWMSRLKKIAANLNNTDYKLYDEVIKFEKIQYRSAAQHYQCMKGAFVRDVNHYERLLLKNGASVSPSCDDLSDEDVIVFDSVPLPNLPGSKPKRYSAPRISRRPRAPTPKEEYAVNNENSNRYSACHRQSSTIRRPRMPTPTTCDG